MKKTLLTLTAGCLLLATSHAQIGNPATVVNAQVLPLSTTSTNAVTISCEDANTVGIQVYSIGNAAATNGVVITFDQSLDGAHWKTATGTISYTATGTTAVNSINTYSVNGIRYMRLNTIAADGVAAAGATNTVTVTAYKKPKL